MTKAKTAAQEAPAERILLTAETLELGRWVRDRITGVEGVAITTNYHLSEMVQVGVQPLSKDGGLPDAFNFDIQNIEYATPPENFTPPVWLPPTVAIDQLEFDLGNKVEDIVTGMRGIATTIVVMLNGCLYVTVEGKFKKKEKSLLPRVKDTVDWQRLKYAGPGVADEVREKMQDIFNNDPDATRGPGGPTTKAFRPGA